VTTGVTLGTTFGAVIPLNIRKLFKDTSRCVNEINEKSLKKYGIVLINPFITNRIYLTSASFPAITSLEFITQTFHNTDDAPQQFTDHVFW